MEAALFTAQQVEQHLSGPEGWRSLPDGRPLCLRAEALEYILDDWRGFDVGLRDAHRLLFFASRTPEELAELWSPRDEDTEPLALDERALQADIGAWASSTFQPGAFREVMEHAYRLWVESLRQNGADILITRGQLEKHLVRPDAWRFLPDGRPLQLVAEGLEYILHEFGGFEPASLRSAHRLLFFASRTAAEMRELWMPPVPSMPGRESSVPVEKPARHMWPLQAKISSWASATFAPGAYREVCGLAARLWAEIMERLPVSGEKGKGGGASEDKAATGMQLTYIRYLCWLVSGGDARHYRELLLETDVCFVFSAFTGWCNFEKRLVITLPEKSRRLAEARALMRGAREPESV